MEQRETERPYDILQLVGPPQHHAGKPASLVFELGGDGTDRDVEIWLPNNARVEILDLKANAPFQPTPHSCIPRWTHYGSSISHSAEAEPPLSTWPAVAGRKLGLKLISIAFGGGAHLDHFVARIMRDLEADLISLKVGINIANGDTIKRRTFIAAVHAFLDTIREAKPEVPILLISPLACPIQETNPGPITWDVRSGKLGNVPPPVTGQNFGSLNLTEIRLLLAETVTSRPATDSALYYLNGLELFGRNDAPDLPDEPHPNTAGYLRMGERFVTNERIGEWLNGAQTAVPSNGSPYSAVGSKRAVHTP